MVRLVKHATRAKQRLVRKVALPQEEPLGDQGQEAEPGASAQEMAMSMSDEEVEDED